MLVLSFPPPCPVLYYSENGFTVVVPPEIVTVIAPVERFLNLILSSGPIIYSLDFGTVTTRLPIELRIPLPATTVTVAYHGGQSLCHPSE